MNSRLSMLLVIAGAQLLIVAALLFASTSGTSDEPEFFLSIDAELIDRVMFDDGDGAELTLARSDDGWTLARGMPADDEKMAGVLSKLQELKRPWPVATTSAIQNRFEVSDDKYQRHVQLYASDDLKADFYLGTSPGYRRVHAREVDSSDIFSIDFSNYEIPTTVDEWVDKTLLGASGVVTEVSREGSWRLNKGEEGWLLDDGAADQDAAEKLTGRFANLRIMGVLVDEDGTATTAEGVEHRATFQVFDADGQRRLEVYYRAEEDDYLVQGDSAVGTFTLATYIAEQILIEREDLIPEAEEATTDAS
ncbi:MAG: DUF4340 domain-containing protein [Gammaproteobacteria bacterium]|nr:DUF4340 domain-containing protein [Gammaproteobacteria bacterium]